MPTKIYDIKYVKLIDGTSFEVAPLKIYYMRQFMDRFAEMQTNTDIPVLDHLVDCSLIAMKQYYPEIKTVEQLEDIIDIHNMYKLIEYCSGIKMSNDESTQQESKEVEKSDSSSNWENLDLAKLESEAFILGIWKDYDELEKSLSLAELLLTLEAKRDLDYQDKKFNAAIQGVDIDADNKQEEDPWEAMKARVAAATSGIGTGDPNDITALQGIRAQQAGFGIGMGLDYQVYNG
jgi:hypothetical protein